MRFLASALACASLVASFQVLADDPPAAASAKPAAAPATSAPAPAADASAVAATTSQVAATKSTTGTVTADAANNDGTSEAQIKKYRGMGYKPVTQNGRTLFCREETPLGSRFPAKTCRTAEALDYAVRQGQEDTAKHQLLSQPQSR